MTGVRIIEAQALNWKDINFEKKLLTINKSMYYKNTNEFYITEIKISSSNRIISLDNKTVDKFKTMVMSLKWKFPYKLCIIV